MILNPKNIEKLGEMPSHLKIRTMNSSTLILIKKDGDIIVGRTVRDKDPLIDLYKNTGGMLLFAWHGQYRTDVFLMAAEDVDKYYK